MFKIIRNGFGSITFDSNEVQAVILCDNRFSLLLKGNANPVTFAIIEDFTYHNTPKHVIIEAIMLCMKEFLSSKEEYINMRLGFERSMDALTFQWRPKEVQDKINENTDVNRDTFEDLDKEWQQHKSSVNLEKESEDN